MTWFLRAVLGLWALLFMLGMLLLGLVLGTGLLVWALLRGRRPVIRGRPWGPLHMARRGPVAPGDVVDVQAREIERG